MFDSRKEGKIEAEKVRTILNTLGHTYDDQELEALLESEDGEGNPFFFYFNQLSRRRKKTLFFFFIFFYFEIYDFVLLLKSFYLETKKRKL